jgi:hypothetical protein
MRSAVQSILLVGELVVRDLAEAERCLAGFTVGAGVAGVVHRDFRGCRPTPDGCCRGRLLGIGLVEVVEHAPGAGLGGPGVGQRLRDPGHPDLWEAVYRVLAHSANLSKVFWVNSAANADAGRPIVTTYPITCSATASSCPMTPVSYSRTDRL